MAELLHAQLDIACRRHAEPSNHGHSRHDRTGCIIPASKAGETPFDLYDVELLDRDGIDVLGGKGINLPNTTVVDVAVTDATPVLPIATIGALTLNVAHADSGGSGTHSGTIRIYLRR